MDRLAIFEALKKWLEQTRRRCLIENRAVIANAVDRRRRRFKVHLDDSMGTMAGVFQRVGLQIHDNYLDQLTIAFAFWRVYPEFRCWWRLGERDFFEDGVRQGCHIDHRTIERCI